MLSIGLWRWYINITITILYIIRRPVFYIKLYFIGLSVPHSKHINYHYKPNRLMPSKGLWWWYFNVTQFWTYQSFILERDISETRLCLRLQVEPTQIGPIERAILCLLTPVGFIKPSQHRPPKRVNTVLMKMLTFFGGLFCIGFINIVDIVACVRRQRLALSIGSFRVSSTWRRRPESSLRNVAFWIKDRRIDNVKNSDSYMIRAVHLLETNWLQEL
jgi:hypothetical protein